MKKFLFVIIAGITVNGLMAMNKEYQQWIKQRKEQWKRAQESQDRNNQLLKQFIDKFREKIEKYPHYQYYTQYPGYSPGHEATYNIIINTIIPDLQNILQFIDRSPFIPENEKEALKQNIVQMDYKNTFVLLPTLAPELQSTIIPFLIKLELSEPWSKNDVLPNIEKFLTAYLSPSLLTQSQINQYFQMLDEKIVGITHRPWYPSLTFMLNMLDPQNKLMSKTEKKAILSKSYSKEEYQKISQQIANKILSYRNSIDYLLKSGQLPFDSFDLLRLTEDLDLKNKNLATLLPNMFQEFNVLDSLDISNNKLEKINAADLKGLSNLAMLYLNKNELNTVAPNAFQDLSKLEFLYLNDNKLKEITTEIFKNLSNLTYLVLSHNFLTTIEPDTFANLRNLDTLDLSNNQLTHIKPGSFSNLNNLKTLYLSNNQLETLDTDELKGLPLQKIYLEGNQFSLDEQLRISKELLSSRPNLYIKMLQEDTPGTRL